MITRIYTYKQYYIVILSTQKMLTLMRLYTKQYNFPGVHENRINGKSEVIAHPKNTRVKKL